MHIKILVNPLARFAYFDQVDDVARALAWTQRNIGRYGGDARSLFLVGHSAGAYLAARVAFDRELAARRGMPDVCGIASVSGAGFDLDEALRRVDGGIQPDAFR